MSLATGLSLFLVLGLAALMGGFASWRLAHNRSQTPAPVAPLPATQSREEDAPQGGAKFLLPIERKGNRQHIAVNEVFCVRANGRSTYLFNGRNDVFCPLSISELDALLPRQFFFRCHRGYIVNLAHVSGVKKVGDAGVVELDSPLRRAAPITHGRVAALREELHAFRSGAPRAEKSMTRSTTCGRLAGDGSHFQ